MSEQYPCLSAYVMWNEIKKKKFLWLKMCLTRKNCSTFIYIFVELYKQSQTVCLKHWITVCAVHSAISCKYFVFFINWANCKPNYFQWKFHFLSALNLHILYFCFWLLLLLLLIVQKTKRSYQQRSWLLNYVCGCNRRRRNKPQFLIWT